MIVSGEEFKPVFRVRLADPHDDAAIRRLLHEREMAGTIRLSLEREPSYFASLDRECQRHNTVLVEDNRDGTVIGMGARQVYPALASGESARVGYLNQIRLSADRRLPLRAAVNGWKLMRSCLREDELPFDVTSIAADNHVARRLLERGLPGQPRYHPITDYVVHAIPTSRRRPAGTEYAVREADPGKWNELLALRTENLSDKAFALLGKNAESPEIRLIALKKGNIVAGLGVEDATPWRQFVVRGYDGVLKQVRPVLNLGLRLLRAPRLPSVGETLRTGTVVSMACRKGEEAAVIPLLRHAGFHARSHGLDLLLTGFVTSDRLEHVIRKSFRTRSYRTIIYAVAWNASQETMEDVANEDCHLELCSL